MKQFARLVDIALLCLLGALGFFLMAPPARAQVTEAPPSCNPFTDGVGHVVGRVDGAEGAHWWCPPADPFGDWVSARAARLIAPGASPEVRGQAETMALVAARTLDTRAPEFSELWRSMASAVAASKPPARWVVASAQAGTRQAYRITEAGGLSDMAGFTIASGTPCDCRVRISQGSTHFCRASISDRVVAMCTMVP